MDPVHSPSESNTDLELPASLASQLELWTNLTFQSDEPAPPPNHSAISSGDFDLDGFLSQFHGPSLTGIQPAIFTSQDGQALGGQIGWSEAQLGGLGISAMASAGSSAISGRAEEPPSKKRTRKASVAESDRPSTVGPGEYDSPNSSLTPAEDKRRRNTAASARFRLKKKERELAMERNLKHLDQRVNELEREAEGLRKENGWLRGLLVGVNVPASTLVTNVGSKEESKEETKKEVTSEA